MTEKTAPELKKPEDRSAQATQFMTSNASTPKTDTRQTRPNKAQERKHKAAIRYMQQQGIKDIESVDFLRLNCDIPEKLHVWLNVFARTSKEYNSMTEIVIEQLGKFAKKHGFNPNE